MPYPCQQLLPPHLIPCLECNWVFLTSTTASTTTPATTTSSPTVPPVPTAMYVAVVGTTASVTPTPHHTLSLLQHILSDHIHLVLKVSLKVEL